ncbi:MAG: GNAT family N-acetyltransferase [Gemmatimonadota bacterium]|nr:GNAT family N-acetyltransferase [Gemmatimonadota bacterium]
MPDTAATFTIRQATPDDAAAVAAFAERTFVETFGADNTPEDLAAHVAITFGTTQQSRELRNPNIITLLGETGDTLIALAQLRSGQYPPCVTGAEPVELMRFYVDRPWHGQGVAQLLMCTVRDTARQAGARTLWLGVWERNPRAIAFYAKCGFTDVGEQEFILGSDRQTDRVMARSLQSDPR